MEVRILIDRYEPIAICYDAQYHLNGGIYEYTFSNRSIGVDVFFDKEEAVSERALRRLVYGQKKES